MSFDDVTARPLHESMLYPPGSDLAIAEWTSPAGERVWIAPLHVHHEADEIWYVLDGEMILHLDGELVTLRAGDSGIAVRGTAHTYRNAGPGALRYLLVMTRQVADLIAALHAAPPDPDALPALFQKYGSTYLGWLGEPARSGRGSAGGIAPAFPDMV